VIMAQRQQSVLAEMYPLGIRSFPLSVVPDDSDETLEARILLRSMVVGRILAGAGTDVVQLVIQQSEFGESEPLLLAGAALAHSWLDITDLALARAGSELAQRTEPELSDVLSLALLNMATSRLRDEADLGLAQVRHVEELMAKLTAPERAQTPELPPLIDYYIAGFELSRGNLGTARWTLERGAGRFRQWLDAPTDAEQLVRAACAGQLAWIDAVCGDLRRATRYASSLLTDRQADSGEIGVLFAHLATAWTHVERGEIEQATQRLDHAQSRNNHNPDPVLAAAERLTQVRLALATDEPETALRLLESTSMMNCEIVDGWFADQFLLARAESLLAVAEPQQAIAVLTPAPELAATEARLILVRAARLAGDRRAAKQMLGQVPSDPVAMSIISQTRRWLLQAELAIEQGNYEQAQLLVDRALRTATREQLRATVGWAGSWLRAFVARDSGLSHRHAAFLASVPLAATSTIDQWQGEAGARDATLVVPLTARETDVLRLLAQLCTNEEIAADLVLSMNTVKTHIRSLFQKLSVTRRADAVRRGRALGLC
jgi:LuxR family transcriptional regulator, maltose regulon positive regulatory protein